MSNGLTILFRADASESIGAGHLMRSLSLAEGFREKGWTALFATRTHLPRYLKVLQDRKLEWVSIPDRLPLEGEAAFLSRSAQGYTVKGVMVDRYGLPDDYFVTLRENKPTWVLGGIDDWGKGWRGMDLILNQNMGADALQYQKAGILEPATRILAGSQYALLRPEFRRGKRPLGERRGVKRIMLTLGGSDPDNFTRLILEVLVDATTSEELHVVLGPGFTHPEIIRSMASGQPRIRLHQDVRDMHGLMATIDLSVNGSGSTLWELFYMGIPNLLYILADNQREAARQASARGCSVSMGLIESFNPGKLKDALQRLLSSPEERRQLAEKAHEAIDGKGVERVVDEFTALIPEESSVRAKS